MSLKTNVKFHLLRLFEVDVFLDKYEYPAIIKLFVLDSYRQQKFTKKRLPYKMSISTVKKLEADFWRGHISFKEDLRER